MRESTDEEIADAVRNLVTRLQTGDETAHTHATVLGEYVTVWVEPTMGLRAEARLEERF